MLDKQILKSFLNSNKLLAAKMMTSVFAAKLLSAGIPILIGIAVDSISNGKDANLNSKWILGLSEFFSVTSFAAILIALSFAALFMLLVLPVQQKIQTQFVQNLVLEVSTKCMQKVFRKDLRFFNETNPGRINQIIERGVHGSEKMITQIINSILPILVESIVAVVVLYKFSGLMGISVAGLIVLFQIAITLHLIKYRRPLISALNDAEDDVAEETFNLFSKGFIFLLYQKGEIAVQRLRQVSQKYVDQCVQVSLTGSLIGMIPFQFQILGNILALVIGHQMMSKSGSSVGDVIVLISVLTRFSSSISESIGTFRILDQFKLDIAEAVEILKFPDFERQGHSFDSLHKISIDQGEFSTSGLSLKVAEDLSFSIGDRVAIVGSSGSGKSTFLQFLAGLDSQSRKQVRLNGVAIEMLSSDQQVKSLKYCPQDPYIFSGTLQENMFTAEVHKSENLLKDLNLEMFKMKEMNWVEPAEISGGEAKRLSIARALSSKSSNAQNEVLLLDEPTAGLNDELRHQTWQMIVENAQNRILVAVTHDQDSLKYFNKVIRIHNGEVRMA